MTLAEAKARMKEIEGVADVTQRTMEMRELVMKFKGEVDRPPLRHLTTPGMMACLDSAFRKSYGAMDKHCGVDTEQGAANYEAYIAVAADELDTQCYTRKHDENEPVSDEEKVVLDGLAAKAHVWMTCHPHLLLSDHQRMPFLTKSVLKVIVAGLSRMPSTLSEVSRSSLHS